MLQGLRVVEFARLLAGPFCGLTLSDLGADVIKVETPSGDESRTFPPFAESGESGFFHALNRGKRGVVLDLTTEGGLDTARRLVATADVVVENHGGRLGLAREEFDPKLVWCSVSGLGAAEGGRAVDPSLQATLGLMSLTGERDGPPLRVPVPLIDFMTGMYASQQTLLALWHAERTGEGAFVDCALVDSAATLTSTVALLSLSGFLEPGRIGSESYLAVPSAVFETADREHLQVVAVHEGHWRGLCRALGHPEWIDDPRSSGYAARVENRDLVHDRIRAAIAAEPATHWLDVINAAGGMCERVRGVGEAWADALLARRGLVGRLEGEPLGGYPLPLVSLARTANPEHLAPGPRLGEHTDEVLAGL